MLSAVALLRTLQYTSKISAAALQSSWIEIHEWSQVHEFIRTYRYRISVFFIAQAGNVVTGRSSEPEEFLPNNQATTAPSIRLGTERDNRGWY